MIEKALTSYPTWHGAAISFACRCPPNLYEDLHPQIFVALLRQQTQLRPPMTAEGKLIWVGPKTPLVSNSQYICLKSASFCTSASVCAASASSPPSPSSFVYACARGTPSATTNTVIMLSLEIEEFVIL